MKVSKTAQERSAHTHGVTERDGKLLERRQEERDVEPLKGGRASLLCWTVVDKAQTSHLSSKTHARSRVHRKPNTGISLSR